MLRQTVSLIERKDFHMNIDERFEKLEKQNETFAGQIKTLKKMLGGVAALALAALIGRTVLKVHTSEEN